VPEEKMLKETFGDARAKVAVTRSLVRHLHFAATMFGYAPQRQILPLISSITLDKLDR
jgi:hypothetical protein